MFTTDEGELPFATDLIKTHGDGAMRWNSMTWLFLFLAACPVTVGCRRDDAASGSGAKTLQAGDSERCPHEIRKDKCPFCTPALSSAGVLRRARRCRGKLPSGPDVAENRVPREGRRVQDARGSGFAVRTVPSGTQDPGKPRLRARAGNRPGRRRSAGGGMCPRNRTGEVPLLQTGTHRIGRLL